MKQTVPIPATVDTCGFSIPVLDFDVTGCRTTVENTNQPDESYRYARTLKGGGFVNTGIAERAWIEASLPKRVHDGDNSQGLPVQEALAAMRDLLAEAAEFLELAPGARFEDCRVVRLDLVRDFHGVDDPTPLLDGLAAVNQPGRAKVRRFADPSANRAETLRVGPKAWGVTLYDKHAESGGRSPAGQLRAESRLHRPQLTSRFQAQHGGGCINTIADLDRSSGEATASTYFMGHDHLPGGGGEGPQLRAQRAHGGARSVGRMGDGGASLGVAQRAWFDRVGFGLDVRGENALSRRLRAAGLSSADQAGLWAFLTLPGWAASAHRNTRAKYRALATDLGVAPAFDNEDRPVKLERPEAVSVVRLDYEKGRLLAA